MKTKNKKKIKKIAEKIEKLLEAKIISYFGKLLYFIGLTALVPILPIVLFSEKGFLKLANEATIISILFVAIGLMLTFAAKESTRKSLRYIGIVTITPAIAAFIFSFFGKRTILALVEKYEIATYLIIPWINKYVPTVITIAIFYSILGIALIISSFFWKK